jgi:3-methyladenine DNA glycosylase AlkD
VAAEAVSDPTAERFVAELRERQSDQELRKIQRYFKSGEGEYGEGDVFLGVRMGDVFALAKRYVEMPPEEIEKLLESELHEVRAGACSVMAKQAAHKGTSEERRGELYSLYRRRIDRINNWDLVDLAARDVVGRWLHDKPRKPFEEMARSDDVWERRTAIYATSFQIRQGELDETFRVAAILAADDHDLVQKSVGGWLREAGKHDEPRLLDFLDARAGSMGPTAVRYATEKLSPEQRRRYRRGAAG